MKARITVLASVNSEEQVVNTSTCGSSAKTHSTVFAITIPFIITCIPPFVGRLEAFARVMTLFPDQLLSINKNLEDFSLYHIGGNILGSVSVIIPLYLILFCLIFPLLFIVYRRTQIK